MEDFLTYGTELHPEYGAKAAMDPWAYPPAGDPKQNVLSAEVDGISLTNLPSYRGTSKLERLKADLSNQATDPCIIGKPQPMVSDGYWIMLRPLQVGSHIIHFSVTRGGPTNTIIDVTYNVTSIK